MDGRADGRILWTLPSSNLPLCDFSFSPKLSQRTIFNETCSEGQRLLEWGQWPMEIPSHVTFSRGTAYLDLSLPGPPKAVPPEPSVEKEVPRLPLPLKNF